MKKLLTILACIFLMLGASAQARPTTVKFNKSSRPALVLQLPYSKTIAEGAIIQKLREIGYKPQTSNSLLFIKKNTVDGFYMFRRVLLEGQAVDMYFKVDQVGKKEKSASNVYLMVGEGPETFVSGETNTNTFGAAAGFLNGMSDYSASYKMDVDISGQEQLVKEAEQKLTKLKEEETLLTDKINNNKLQQDNQTKVLEAERAKLDKLKTRKGAKG